MPKKLDDCVDKVMNKGHDRSSAFAICKASLGLRKEAISSSLARKVFNKRYMRMLIKEDEAINPFDDVYGKVKRSDLFGKRLNKYDNAQKALEKARSKVERAAAHMDKRTEWEFNKSNYGKREPSFFDKAKKKFQDAFSGYNEKNGLQSIKKPALQVA